MRDVLKFYIPMLIVLISIMFASHAPALKEGKALAVIGLYTLFSLVLFASMVLLRVGYFAEGRSITRATTFLSLILNVYPILYMLITQTADPVIISLTILIAVAAVYMMIDRLY